MNIPPTLVTLEPVLVVSLAFPSTFFHRLVWTATPFPSSVFRAITVLPSLSAANRQLSYVSRPPFISSAFGSQISTPVRLLKPPQLRSYQCQPLEEGSSRIYTCALLQDCLVDCCTSHAFLHLLSFVINLDCSIYVACFFAAYARVPVPSIDHVLLE